MMAPDLMSGPPSPLLLPSSATWPSGRASAHSEARDRASGCPKTMLDLRSEVQRAILVGYLGGVDGGGSRRSTDASLAAAGPPLGQACMVGGDL